MRIDEKIEKYIVEGVGDNTIVNITLDDLRTILTSKTFRDLYKNKLEKWTSQDTQKPDWSEKSLDLTRDIKKLFSDASIKKIRGF